jgi:hypothetical protein
MLTLLPFIDPNYKLWRLDEKDRPIPLGRSDKLSFASDRVDRHQLVPDSGQIANFCGVRILLEDKSEAGHRKALLDTFSQSPSSPTPSSSAHRPHHHHIRDSPTPRPKPSEGRSRTSSTSCSISEDEPSLTPRPVRGRSATRHESPTTPTACDRSH